MKKIALLFSLFIYAQLVKAQVAINNTGNNPNTSAMLDIASNNKGLLIPRVFLASLVDNATIPSPATSLLVYNTNTGLSKGASFYYNNGTPASPNWQPVQDLILPFTKGTSTDGSAFTIENYSQNAASTAIKAVGGGAGNALEVSGKMKIAGSGQTPAQGKVLTSDANGNATWQGGVAFSAVGVKTGGSETFAYLVEKKVPFATEVYDIGNNYTDANTSPHSTFTAPVKGIYHFDAKISWVNLSASGNFDLTLYRLRNGVQSPMSTSGLHDVELAENNVSIDVLLEAGDQVYVGAQHSHSGTIELNFAPNAAHFNGRLVMKL